MKKISKHLIEEIIKRLVSELEPEQIFMFGSHVWGRPGEDSDLDFLVIVPNSNKTPIQRARKAYRCMRGLNIPKDILVKTRAEINTERRVYSSLVAEILEKGQILYGKGQN